MARSVDPPSTATETPSLHARRSLLRLGFMPACAVSVGALLVVGVLVLMPMDHVDDHPEQASSSETVPLADDGSPPDTRNGQGFQGDTVPAGREDSYGSSQSESQDTVAAGDAIEGSDTERRSDAGNRTRPVPLDRMNIDVSRPVEPALGRAGTAADELHQRGHFGDDDTLAPAGPEGRLGSRVLTRTRQEHHGIPVFAAEVVILITTEDERIVKIYGHPATGIDLGTTTPAHDYPATVTLAQNVLRHDVARENDGLLVIVAVEDGYRLAWLGVVVIDRGPEQVAFDADTGDVLHRAPMVRHAAAAAAAGEGGR